MMRPRFPVSVLAVGLLASTAQAIDQQGAAARLKAAAPHAQLRYDNGRLSRVYGKPVGFGATPEAAAARFVRDHSEAFGVPADDMAFVRTQSVMNDKFTAVYYHQTHRGIPVHQAWTTILTRPDLNNGIVLVSSELFDLSGARLAPIAVSGGEAMAKLVAAHEGWEFGVPELVIYRGQLDADEGWDFTYAYRVTGQNSFKPQIDNGDVMPEAYEFMLDATRPDAPIIGRESRIYHVDVNGTVTGMATPGELPDRVDNPPVSMPLDDMRVRIVGGSTGQTDATGAYTVANGGATDVTVQAGVAGSGATQAGQWVRVDDLTGGEQALSQVVTPPGPANFAFNAVPSEFETAEINGFKLTTDVHNFVKSINPAYPGVDVQMPCFVNRSDGFCPGNAWYNFSVDINFCRTGGGFPNTAYSSVVYHEYGHHIIASGHPAATGDFHEGVADVTSSLLMDTACLGRGFTGGSGCLRNAVNGVNYPCSGEGHFCGQVISGAYWLTRNELAISNPGTYLDIIRPLYLNMILTQPPAINPSLTIDVLTLDDDNGDIADGTPHYNEIATGFGAKNLDAPPLQLLQFVYPNGRPTTIPSNVTSLLRVNVNPLTFNPEADTGRFFYDVGSGFVEGTMQVVSPNVYDAVLPAVPCGTVIRYYVSAETTTMATATNPNNAPTGNYSTLSATALITELNDDYEANLGWTAGAAGDNATTGIWTRNNPNGTAAQPEDDHTANPGVNCFFTGQGPVGGQLGDNDVDGGRTTLLSPVFDLTGETDAKISYWRWYSNNTGAEPNADTFRVDVTNNGTTWVNAETVGPAGAGTEGGWIFHEFYLADFAAPSSQVRVRFVAEDAAGGSLVEAAVDDFLIETVDCTIIPVQGDVNCDGVINTADVPVFALALLDPAGYNATFPACDILRADMDGNTLVDGDDANLFIDAVIP